MLILLFSLSSCKIYFTKKELVENDLENEQLESIYIYIYICINKNLDTIFFHFQTMLKLNIFFLLLLQSSLNLVAGGPIPAHFYFEKIDY